jgi:hypothetical protein
MSDLITVADAARQLDVWKRFSSIHYAINKGAIKIQGTRGKSLLISLAELKRWLAAHPLANPDAGEQEARDLRRQIRREYDLRDQSSRLPGYLAGRGFHVRVKRLYGDTAGQGFNVLPRPKYYSSGGKHYVGFSIR